MKRIDQVYDYVVTKTKDLSPNELTIDTGVTTKEVADYLGIQRSNASKDLNTLVREGIIEKLDGRPVRYVTKTIFQHKPFSKYVPSYQEEKESIFTIIPNKTQRSDDVFKRIIGINGSMKNAIMQAKAAIL
uniref:helix-turn-helix domain-containing protein n=1 Tax=Staphylococcus haemolyticus TaxID=1283 RepID=UPI002795D71D